MWKSKELHKAILLYGFLTAAAFVLWPIRSAEDIIPTLRERSYYVTGSKATLRLLARRASTVRNHCGAASRSQRPWTDALTRLLRHRPRAIDQLLAEKHDVYRRAAVSALMRMEDPRQCQKLISLLNDRDYEIRAGAAMGLSDLSTQQSNDGLLLATASSSYEVRGIAAEALVTRGIPFDLTPIKQAANVEVESLPLTTLAQCLDAFRGKDACKRVLDKLRKK